MMTAEDIKRLRANARMDRVKFARAVGVPVSTIDMWEAGLAHPSQWEETKLNNLISGRAADLARLAELQKRVQADKEKSDVQTVLFPGGGGASIKKQK